MSSCSWHMVRETYCTRTSAVLERLMEVGFVETWLILLEQVRKKRQFGQRPLKLFCICIFPSEGKKSTSISVNLNHSNFLEGYKTYQRKRLQTKNKTSEWVKFSAWSLQKIYLSWCRRLTYHINRIKVKCFGFTVCCLFHTHMHKPACTHISDSALSRLVEL